MDGAFAAAAPAAVLTAHAFVGLYHEIPNEPEQAQVLGQLTRRLTRFQRPAAVQEKPT